MLSETQECNKRSETKDNYRKDEIDCIFACVSNIFNYYNKLLTSRNSYNLYS